MAKKGDWVRIHDVILKADQRTARLPDDTQKCDFEMWVKGSLLDEKGHMGDTVHVKTASGRVEQGILTEENPHYTHSYGKFVPEMIEIDKQLREIMYGGEK